MNAQNIILIVKRNVILIVKITYDARMHYIFHYRIINRFIYYFINFRSFL